MPTAKRTADRPAIHVPVKLWEKLKDRAFKDDVTGSESLRRAIWLYTTIRDAQERGAEVLIEEGDGSQQRLLLQP